MPAAGRIHEDAHVARAEGVLAAVFEAVLERAGNYYDDLFSRGRVPVHKSADGEFLQEHRRTRFHLGPEGRVLRERLDAGGVVVTFIYPIYTHEIRFRLRGGATAFCEPPLYYLERFDFRAESHCGHAVEHYAHRLPDVIREAEKVFHPEHLDVVPRAAPAEPVRVGVDFFLVGDAPEERILAGGGDVASRFHAEALADDVKPTGSGSPVSSFHATPRSSTRLSPFSS